MRTDLSGNSPSILGSFQGSTLYNPSLPVKTDLFATRADREMRNPERDNALPVYIPDYLHACSHPR